MELSELIVLKHVFTLLSDLSYQGFCFDLGKVFEVEVGPRAFCYLQILVLGGKLLKVVIIICDIESVSLKLDGIASLH